MARSFCHYHPETIAIEKCTRCQKPLCERCQLIVKGSIFCAECSRLTIAGITLTPRRSPAFAALLTLLFPGAGQVYNGEIGKGFIVLGTFWLIIPWGYGIYDAYATARKINVHQVATRLSMPGFLSFVVLVLGVYIVLAGGAARYRQRIRPERRIQQALSQLAESLESYRWGHSSYPQSYAQFISAASTPWDVMICDTVLHGYRIECQFSIDGYKIAATPKAGIKSIGPAYLLQTGGVISTP